MGVLGGVYQDKIGLDQVIMPALRPTSPVFISKLLPVLPKFEVLQADAAQWLGQAYRIIGSNSPEKSAINQKMYDRLAKRTAIDSRRTVLSDYAQPDPTMWQVFSKSGSIKVPNLEDRMAVFADAGLELARRAYESCDFSKLARVFLVSCTGYDSPSILQRLLPAGWSGQYAMLGHMGCYAALPALSIAGDCLTAVADSSIDASIFLCEFCTLHLDPLSEETEQQVINMLFADGAIRVDLTTDESRGVFQLVDRFEFLVPESLDQMTWRPAAQNFRMTLSAGVPKQIQSLIRAKVVDFLQRSDFKIDDIAQWAIHPGGVKIIEPIAEMLGVAHEKIGASLQIYRSRGNMSSTTVPHIWHRMAEDSKFLKSGDLVLSMAFGPGLTIVGNLMRRC